MEFEDYLQAFRGGTNLTRSQATDFLNNILDDKNLTDAKIAEALTLLTKKNPTVEEVCGLVDSMRARMLHVETPDRVIDTCGTGGDKLGTFNISTAAAILLAAGGAAVAKHGNRAVTSLAGSADVLEALGIPIDLEPEAAAKALVDHKFVFLFARQYHPSMKSLAQIRRQLGFPTVFNLLGPLLNPAATKRQVIGTFNLENAELLAQVMAKLNYQHGIVLTSEDGLDEASLSAPVHLFEIKQGVITEMRLRASDYGLEPASTSDLEGADAAHNAKLVVGSLRPPASEELNAHQRVVVLNAGLGFYVAGQTPTLQAGIQKAIKVLASGAAAAKLTELKVKK